MAALLSQRPSVMMTSRAAAAPMAPLAVPITGFKRPVLAPLSPSLAPLGRPQLPVAKPQKHVAVQSASDDAVKELDPLESTAAKIVGAKAAPAVVTLGFILLWYALNVSFNLLNKSIFKYFPFPYTVSTVHVLVGSVYCIIVYLLGLKSWSFGRPVTKEEFGKIFGPASMHAIGHVAANVSFAAVAISLTHTVKTLEPAFNVILSQLILGQATPLPVVLSLVPIMLGVAMASAGELSFNWLGFSTAMASNLTFGFRAVWSKMAMTKTLDSTALYAYTTLISFFICAPFVMYFEWGILAQGAADAIAKVGAQKFWTDLALVGLLYHLYNQFAFNTLQRVSPVAHGVCNVVKRVAIIFSSVIFFNQTLTPIALTGTVVALAGTWLYTEMSSRYKSKPSPPPASGSSPAAA